MTDVANTSVPAGDSQSRPTLRIFISSPGDVGPERRRAALIIEHLAKDYARFFAIEPVLWETEPMLASGHFQDHIVPPAETDIVVVILWSRLGSPLPEKTAVRAYKGIRDQSRVTGTEWEFESALAAQRKNDRPAICVYRKSVDPKVPLRDLAAKAAAEAQWASLEQFWQYHFVAGGCAFKEFADLGQFETAIERDLRQLIDRLVERIVGQARPVWHDSSPFRGLESYHFEHASIFFGRSGVTKIAIERLIENSENGQPFLLVLGASGSGKSSLAKAGIVPALELRGVVSGVGLWRHAVMRPSGHPTGPFAALAEALAAEHALPELLAHGQRLEDLAEHFSGAAKSPSYPVVTALIARERAARERHDLLDNEEARLVIVIDQLEELFTMQEMLPEKRKNFIDCIIGLLRSGRVFVVATMRNDHWHRAAEIPQLVDLAQGNGRIDLLAPTEAEIAEMVRRPAEAAGLTFEADPRTDIRLDASLAAEAAKQAGSLPLLSFLLDALYLKDVHAGGRSVLSCASAAELGGLKGAIAQRAEAAFEALPEKAKAVFPKVLRALVTVGRSEGMATAREAPMSRFKEGSPERQVVDALTSSDARLLVGTGDGEGAQVCVAHEALITHWDRAARQIAQDRDDLRTRVLVEEGEVEWHAATELKNKDATDRSKGKVRARDYLLREPQLSSAVDLARRWPDELAPELLSFIDLSNRAAKAASRRRWVIAAVVMLSLAGLAAASIRAFAVAENQRNEALTAQSDFLAKEARSATAQGNAVLGMLLALAALPQRLDDPARPFVAQAYDALSDAYENRRERAVLRGHAGPIDAVAFSPDGTRLATASQDSTVRIWNTATGAFTVLRGHQGPVWSATFSSNGEQVLTASADKTARLWNLKTGTSMVLKGHQREVHMAAFALTDSVIVTASWDGTLRLWDGKTGIGRAVLQAGPQPVNSMAVSRDGKWVVAASGSGASGDGITTLWDIGRAAMIGRFPADDPATAVAISPDGNRIATGYFDGTIRLWDRLSGSQIQNSKPPAPVAVLTGHERQINKLAFSADGARLVSASDDMKARLWDAKAGTLIAVLGHQGSVIDAGFSEDGLYLMTASSDASVGLWDPRTGTQIAMLRGHDDEVISGAFSPDGRTLATGSADATAREWSLETRASQIVYRGHKGKVLTVALSPDGSRVLTGADDGTALLWDSKRTSVSHALTGHEEAVTCAAFSPDGRYILTASLDRTARVWDAKTGAFLVSLVGHHGPITDCAFSTDGKRAVTASYDRTARVWDAKTGAELGVLDVKVNRVNAARFSPDGSKIVTTSDDGVVRLWNASNFVQIAALKGHSDAVRPVAFSPDGSLIVTGSDDHTARVWDSKTGRQIALLEGHQDVISDVAFSPDSTRVATASWDKTARLWEARTGKLIAVLEGHTRQLKSVAFSPDNVYIATASADGTAMLWSAESGELRAVLHGHVAGINDAVFALDGDRLATAADDMTARLWTAPPRCQELINAALTEKDRDLDAAERSRYFLGENSAVGAGGFYGIVRKIFAPYVTTQGTHCH